MSQKASGAAKPIVHAPPTPATIKKLYATAFRCGKPDCRQPLYRLDDETGEIILNSNISHICARSEGGPRWDAEMSEDDNRNESNLIPMCFGHAREIDDHWQRYPVEDLRGWRQLQINEHIRLQKNWTLTDDEAATIAAVSFVPVAVGTAVAEANAYVAAARAVGVLTVVARQHRRSTAEAAQTWREGRALTQERMSPVWDAATGEELPKPEPAADQTQPLREGLSSALSASSAAVSQHIAGLAGELHAIRAARPDLDRWCGWVEAAADCVEAAVGRWPGDPPEDDDGQLGNALTQLAEASAALSAAWNGQTGVAPPDPLPTSPVFRDPVAKIRQAVMAHRALLDRALPWSRVDTRPFDPQLYADLIEGARFVLDLPTTLRYRRIDLNATARLAGKVARNASDNEFADLIRDASNLNPLAVAVSLLHELMLVARSANRPELESAASDAARQTLSAVDWSDRTVWEGNHHHTRFLLGWLCTFTAAEEIRAQLAGTLAASPELLEVMLAGIAQHAEHFDLFTGEALGIRSHIDQIPDWFPGHEAAEEIRRQHPGLHPLDPDEHGHVNNEILRLASNVLHLYRPTTRS